MANRFSEKLQSELRELHLLRDEDIDTSDIAETADWSRAVRGLWTAGSLQHRKFDVRALANEILKRAWARDQRPTNMGLNKLTWFVFERAVLELGQLLTEARAEAWDHGPVFREIYSSSKKFEDKPIEELLTYFSKLTKKMETAEQVFDPAVDELIDSTLKAYGHLSTTTLRALSHKENSAWSFVWNSGQKTSAGMVISANIIVAAARMRREANEQ